MHKNTTALIVTELVLMSVIVIYFMCMLYFIFVMCLVIYVHAFYLPLSTLQKVKQSRYTPWRLLGGEEV
jgi:hypothetical protein